MNKETDEFLSLYKTYEGLLRKRGTDYRAVEEKLNSDRMRMMRQMRNYLCHSEDPGFVIISPVCLEALKIMIKEENMNQGGMIQNYLVTPAKGSIKEGTKLSEAVYRLSVLAMKGIYELPVYDDRKRLKGVVTLERLAYEMKKQGDIPLDETKLDITYGKGFHLVKPDDPVPEERDNKYYCCTKDGTLDTQYMGYLDMPAVKI